MSKMYENFKTDPNAEKEGIIIDFGDFRITIARAGGKNKQYLRQLEQLTRPFKRAIQMEQMDNETAQGILKIVYARTIIRNWEVKETAEGEKAKWTPGIPAEDGSVLPLSEDNIILTFDNLPDLFADLMEQAGKAALYRTSLREAASKN